MQRATILISIIYCSFFLAFFGQRGFIPLLFDILIDGTGRIIAKINRVCVLKGSTNK